MTEAQSVVGTFTMFRQHAEDCERCEVVRRQIGHGWDIKLPMAPLVDSWWNRACPRGKELLSSWVDVCNAGGGIDIQPDMWGPAA